MTRNHDLGHVGRKSAKRHRGPCHQPTHPLHQTMLPMLQNDPRLPSPRSPSNHVHFARSHPASMHAYVATLETGSASCTKRKPVPTLPKSEEATPTIPTTCEMLRSVNTGVSGHEDLAPTKPNPDADTAYYLTTCCTPSHGSYT